MTRITTTLLTSFAGLLAVALLAMNVRAEARRAPQVGTLVMRTASSYSERKLEIDLKSGHAQLFIFGISVRSENGDPPTDLTRIVEGELPFSEAQDLRRLAAAADLFKGNTAGVEFDLAYRTIEGHRHGEVSTAVVTGNQSFQSGPRKELLHRLVVEEGRLLGEK
jgi:hypothetical protein